MLLMVLHPESIYPVFRSKWTLLQMCTFCQHPLLAWSTQYFDVWVILTISHLFNVVFFFNLSSRFSQAFHYLYCLSEFKFYPKSILILQNFVPDILEPPNFASVLTALLILLTLCALIACFASFIGFLSSALYLL